MKIKVWTLAALALFQGSQIAAQDAGALLRDRERAEQLRPQEPVNDDEAEVSQSEERSTPDGPTIDIQQLTFAGDIQLLSDVQKADLRSRSEQKELDFPAVQSLAVSATAMLRQNGHLLARALILPQDVTDGELTITIQSGTLEGVEFERSEKVRIAPWFLEAIAGQFIDPSDVNESGIESALLRMNDLPAVQARSRLVAGSQPGTTQLVIQVQEDPVLAATAFGDNFGSPTTGQAQGHMQLALRDVTGAGDQTILGVSISEGQLFLSGGFDISLNASGVSLSLSYGYLDYDSIDPIGRAAGLEGYAHFGSLGLNWQAIRSRKANLRFFALANGKALIDESSAGRINDKRILSGTIGVTGHVQNNTLGGAVTQATVSWTYGDLDLSRAPNAEFIDAIGLRTQGGFHLVNASLVRFQTLADSVTLFTSVNGQWASKNLDSAENYALGGPFGVRGWPVGEGRGDQGLISNTELQYDIATKKVGDIQLFAFFDAGRVRINRNRFGIHNFNACGCNSYSLSNAGLGLNWQHERFRLSASWAHGLGSNPGRSAFDGTNVDGQTDRQQFWVSGSIRF